MEFNETHFTQKIEHQLLSMYNDYYTEAKSHTIALIPFFGLLHMYGNESRPILNFSEMNLLSYMSNPYYGFKKLIVYPGINPYMTQNSIKFEDYYKQIVEFQPKQQYSLSRIINQSLGQISSQNNNTYKEILEDFKEFITNNNHSFKKYPLPYEYVSNVTSHEKLIELLKNTYSSEFINDPLSNIVLVYPSEFIYEKENDSNFNNAKKTIEEINGQIFIGQNRGHGYLKSLYHYYLLEDKFNTTVVHSLTDFSKNYCNHYAKEARKVFEHERIYQKITYGSFGKTPQEIIHNLDNINIKELYSKYHTQIINELNGSCNTI